jgi:hypothetical protein
VSGSQDLSVTSNAGNGFNVYLRGKFASTNLRSAQHNWADVAGTYASPAAIGAGERFGFTYHDSSTPTTLSNPASATFVALDATNRAVVASSAVSGSGCVSYTAQSVSATQSGVYSATVIYTAVPNY